MGRATGRVRGRLAGRQGERFGGINSNRRISTAFRISRPRISVSKGNYVINQSFTPTPTRVTVPTKPNLSFPPPKQPFSALTATAPPPNPPHTPLFKSFADLFKSNPRPTLNQKGILPTPDSGWTTVSYKMKNRLHPPAHHQPKKSLPSPKRCFLCGNPSHMAKSCPLGDFKCFACNRVGHTSVACPSRNQPSPPAITPLSPFPPPHFVPNITLPESVLDKLENFLCYGFLQLTVGNPSLDELISGLEYYLKVERWKYVIRPMSKSSYFIQFPDAETLDHACSKEYFDLGSFGGSFSPWSADIGLKPLPKFIYTWIELSGLPMHLWDSNFLMLLFEDIGDVITVSDDIIIQQRARDCKIMISVKDVSEISRSINFRYTSPNDGHKMEGSVYIKVIGKPLTKAKGKCREYFEEFVRKEVISSQSSGEPPIGLRRATQPQPSQPTASRKLDDAGPSNLARIGKGKKVIQENLNLAGSIPASPQTHQVEEIISVSFRGVALRIAKSSRELLAASFPDMLKDEAGEPLQGHRSCQPSHHQ